MSSAVRAPAPTTPMAMAAKMCGEPPVHEPPMLPLRDTTQAMKAATAAKPVTLSQMTGRMGRIGGASLPAPVIARSGAPVTTLSLFATRVRRASLLDARDGAALVAELEAAARGLAAEDRAGRAWCKAYGYVVYTSYASLDDLPRRMSVLDLLRRRLDREIAAFAD